MLTTHKKGSERVLLDILGALKESHNGYYALHFCFSELLEHYKTDYQLKISVNIINDLLREAKGWVVITSDYDIFVVCEEAAPNALKKLVFQLRYLYMDDPLAYNDEGEDNERFCKFYELNENWAEFFGAARYKFKELDKNKPAQKLRPDAPHFLSPEKLVNVEGELGKTNISPALRKQPICAAKADGFKTIFNEIYINIQSLSELISLNINLASNRILFRYLTQILDRRVLEIVRKSPQTYLRSAISLNLNIETLLSENFALFDSGLDAKTKKNIIIEIQLADLFNNMKAFMTAKNMIQKSGYRICLDGMDSLGFLQVDRNSLGFDLAKMFWNADIKSDIDSAENKRLKQAISDCGNSRVILSRCDNREAVYYGQSLGISLFQGRYIDSIIDPDSNILN
ncbi:MAG: hypothetical protein COV36_07105 [Alphaproteobacteria bacterium CG11_big_fil_rev_8_21_14_0_20_44_7]|nr:MAG: hypothetical protein COV36_07105 [Alphaproteobacteria bacterium CG11_big_fil_rev_8_21_14_0_20_44_7]